MTMGNHNLKEGINDGPRNSKMPRPATRKGAHHAVKSCSNCRAMKQRCIPYTGLTCARCFVLKQKCCTSIRIDLRRKVDRDATAAEVLAIQRQYAELTNEPLERVQGCWTTDRLRALQLGQRHDLNAYILDLERKLQLLDIHIRAPCDTTLCRSGSLPESTPTDRVESTMNLSAHVVGVQDLCITGETLDNFPIGSIAALTPTLQYSQPSPHFSSLPYYEDGVSTTHPTSSLFSSVSPVNANDSFDLPTHYFTTPSSTCFDSTDQLAPMDQQESNFVHPWLCALDKQTASDHSVPFFSEYLGDVMSDRQRPLAAPVGWGWEHTRSEFE